jgi:hypothetical protein
MSNDPVAVIYSASFSGALVFVPRAQMEFRAPSPDQLTASQASCVVRLRECRFRPVRQLTLRYSLRNLRVGKAVFRPRPLNHRLGDSGGKRRWSIALPSAEQRRGAGGHIEEHPAEAAVAFCFLGYSTRPRDW